MAGKSLRDLKDRVDVVQSSQLEMRLNNTMIGKYIKVVDEYLLSSLKSNTGHMSIPTMQCFMDLAPDYKSELESLYIEKMGNVADYEQVNVATMMAQAALFDSLCFVYDSTKDEYSLATMNFELLYNLDVEYDMLKQVIKKNHEGIVKAYRIDVEYNNSDEEFTFKAVNARDFDIDESKPDGSQDKRFYLVPYMFSVRFMKLMESLLNKNHTMRVHQSLSGVEKVRFISKDKNVLASYCDIPEAVNRVTAKFFPLKGFFYAPVVGAPSTTAMVTNINIFDVFMIKKATVESFSKYGVHKVKSPIRDLIGDRLVANKLMQLKYTDEGDFACIINNLPNRAKYLSNDVDSISDVSITKYLHSLPEATLKKVYKMVGIEDELQRKLSCFAKSGRAMTPEEVTNIDETLKNHICCIIIQKKDCRLSSMVCTNNKSLLTKIYGDDYVKVYESFGVKFYYFLNWLYRSEGYAEGVNGISISNELSYLGLPNGVEDVEKVLSLRDIVTFEDDLKAYFAERMGINLRRSNAPSSTDSVLSRSVTAYIDENGKPVEYYKNIDKSKILSGIIL